MSMAVAVRVNSPSLTEGITVIAFITACVWVFLSERYTLSLAVLTLYLGIVDGYLKLKTGSAYATLARDVLLYAVCLGLLMRSLVRRQELLPPPFMGVIVAYVVLVAVQLANPGTGGLERGLAAVRPHLEFLPLFFLAYVTLRTKPQLRALLVLLVVIAAANGIVSCMQFNLTPDELAAWGPGYAERIEGDDELSGRTFHDAREREHVRPFGLAGDSGQGGFVGLLALPATIALASLVRTRWRFAVLASGLLVALAIVTSQGRTVMIGAVAAATGYVLLTVVAGRLLRTLAVIAALGVAVLAGTWFSVHGAQSGVFDRVEQIAPSQLMHSATEQRGDSVMLAATYARDYPVGAGLGSVGPAAGVGRTPKALSPDTQFNFLLLELGIPGACVFLALFGAIICRAARRLRSIADPELRVMLAALAAPLLAMAVMFFGSAITAGSPGAPYFWAVAGVLAYWLRAIPSGNGGRQQRLPERRSASPQRNVNRPATALRSSARPVPPADKTHRQTDRSEIPPLPPRAEPRPPSRQAHLVATHIPAAARRCVALMATLLALAGIAARRGHALLRQIAGVVGPMASSGASAAAAATSRRVKVVWALFLRACRLAQAGIQRGTVAGAAAAGRARRALVRLKRSLPSVAQDTGRRIDRFARDGWRLGRRLTRSGTAGQPSSHRRLLLPAVGAIVASALSGIALGRAFEPEEGPPTVSRSGLTVQLPRGWEPAALDPGLPRLSSAIAAAPSGHAGAGFVAAKLRSLVAAERMLERVQRESHGRTRVRLGGLDAWQYAGLRLRPHVVGTGYLVPTTDGAVLGICHAPTSGALDPQAECEHAATTLGVRGERPLPLSSADRSNERVVRVIATLHANRSEGRRRLEAAELGRGQARAATSLKRSYERAARSLDRIAALENGHSLGSLGAALREAAAAYGRLANAASVSDPSAYHDAGHAVVREEEALRRQLARTGGG
jgi:hypothetical protein